MEILLSWRSKKRWLMVRTQWNAIPRLVECEDKGVISGRVLSSQERRIFDTAPGRAVHVVLGFSRHARFTIWIERRKFFPYMAQKFIV